LSHCSGTPERLPSSEPGRHQPDQQQRPAAGLGYRGDLLEHHLVQADAQVVAEDAVLHADDAAFVLSNAETVVIVPGYGLAVARPQHMVKELAAKLTEKGITVKYTIHPVAGRMPGHMNVLLAEAEVPYDQVFEAEDINGEFGQADVAIILGTNDVVNPAAHIKGRAIYGMPILEAYKAKTIIVNKRSMATGYAGLDNERFSMGKTMMVFGDAKKVVEDMVKAIE
jgi:NAD(P) transhydrogenase subunit beta